MEMMTRITSEWLARWLHLLFFVYLFFSELHNTSETLTTQAHSSLWIHARKPYP
jgi:hypothetical protein